MMVCSSVITSRQLLNLLCPADLQARPASCNVISPQWLLPLAGEGVCNGIQGRTRFQSESSQNTTSASCWKRVVCQHSKPQGNRTHCRPQRRSARVSLDSSFAPKSKESSASLKASCSELAPAVDLTPCDGLAFLQSAGLRGLDHPEANPGPGSQSGYVCSEMSDEEFPDRLPDPPLLNIGDVAITSVGAIGRRGSGVPAAVLGNVASASGVNSESFDTSSECGAGSDCSQSGAMQKGGVRKPAKKSKDAADCSRGSLRVNVRTSSGTFAEGSASLQSVSDPNGRAAAEQNVQSEGKVGASLEKVGGLHLDVEQVKVLANALILAKKAEKLVELLESLKESGLSLESIVSAEEVINMLVDKKEVSLALRCLKAFPQSGALYSYAMRAFPLASTPLFWKSLIERIQEEGPMPPPRNYALIAATLLHNRKRAEFVDFVCAFRSASGCSTRDFCSNEALFRDLARDRDVASTLKFLHHGVRPSRLGTEYSKAIAQFSRQRNVAAARAIFDDLVASYPEQIDTFACRAMIDAFKDARLPQEALQIFERMPQWGVQRNKHIYHSLLHAFVLERTSRSELLGARESVLRTCLRLFKQMKGEGIEPDGVTYTILMTIFGAAAQPELAWGVYQELRQKVREEGGAVALTQRQYGAILAVLVEGREVEKAFEVKDDMEAAGLGLDRISWCLLIRACTQVDQVYRAFTVFEEMVRSGCPPSTEAYNVLINACATAGLEDRAWALLDEMKAGGPDKTGGRVCAPDIVTYNTMLKVCYDQPEKAHDILEEITDEGLRPNIRTFNSVIDIYAQKPNPTGARQVYDEMKAAGLLPNVVTYTSLMDTLMKSGDMDGAMGLLEEMKAASVQPNKATYRVLLRVRPEWKLHYDVRRGLRLYEEMRSAGYAPNDSDFENLMDRWAEEQLAARAQEDEKSNAASAAPAGARAPSVDPARPPMFLDLVMRKGSSETAETQELTIDLHGLSRPEARAAVLSLLRTLQLRHAQGWKVQSDLTIITGRGIGSRITGIPVVRAAVLNLLKEELGFPVIAWEPSPDLDDLNLETLNLRSIGARALAPEKLGPGRANRAALDSQEEVGGGSSDQDESVERRRKLGMAEKSDPARELMAEAITAIAGHNEVEVNSLLVHGLGKPGVMKPIPDEEEGGWDEEAARRAKAELTDALLRRVEDSEPLDGADFATGIAESEYWEADDDEMAESQPWLDVDVPAETLANGENPLDGDEYTESSNRYSPDSGWSPRVRTPEGAFEDDFPDVENVRSSASASAETIPESFKRMPPELRERQLQRRRDEERWQQLEEELFYLGPYGQRLLYTRRRLKNQGRIVVPKDALLAWVEGKRKHGRQRRGKGVKQEQRP